MGVFCRGDWTDVDELGGGCAGIVRVGMIERVGLVN